MMKNKVAATPEYAKSKTVVWWDMDSCPVPNGYDPSRLGPRIDTELRNLGYKGPLTIEAIGNLEGIPIDFLRALSSTGIVIKHSPCGGMSILDDFKECDHTPVTVMLISESILLKAFTSELCKRDGYNFLLAYPPNCAPENPHPSSLVVCGEWLWDRASLLKDSGSDEMSSRLDMCSEKFFCGSCRFGFTSFEDFTMHLESRKHARKIEMNNKDKEMKFRLAAEKEEEAMMQSKAPRRSTRQSKASVSLMKESFDPKTKKMMKNKVAATPEYEKSKTVVWWDMDNCPVPNGYDPSRLGPRIDTELRNLGYKGPLTIVAIGNLEGIPIDFLQALSSTGIVIQHSAYGIMSIMEDFYNCESLNHTPVTVMLISESILLEAFTNELCERKGYNFLLAYPPNSVPKDPHPSSLVVCGEWLWDRASLLKDSGSDKKSSRLDKGSEKFYCVACLSPFTSFHNFTMHLKSRKHARKIKVNNEDKEMMFRVAAQNEVEAMKQSKAKQLETKEDQMRSIPRSSKRQKRK